MALTIAMAIQPAVPLQSNLGLDAFDLGLGPNPKLHIFAATRHPTAGAMISATIFITAQQLPMFFRQLLAIVDQSQSHDFFLFETCIILDSCRNQIF